MHLPPRSGLLLESALGIEKEQDHSNTVTSSLPTLSSETCHFDIEHSIHFWSQSWPSLSEHQSTRMHRWLRTASVRLSPRFSVPRVSSEHSSVLKSSVFPLEQKSALVPWWLSYDPKMPDGHQCHHQPQQSILTTNICWKYFAFIMSCDN